MVADAAERYGLAPDIPARLVATTLRHLPAAGGVEPAVQAAAAELGISGEVAAHLAAVAGDQFGGAADRDSIDAARGGPGDAPAQASDSRGAADDASDSRGGPGGDSCGAPAEGGDRPGGGHGDPLGATAPGRVLVAAPVGPAQASQPAAGCCG
jgi:hypothetical protein